MVKRDTDPPSENISWTAVGRSSTLIYVLGLTEARASGNTCLTSQTQSIDQSNAVFPSTMPLSARLPGEIKLVESSSQGIDTSHTTRYLEA